MEDQDVRFFSVDSDRTGVIANRFLDFVILALWDMDVHNRSITNVSERSIAKGEWYMTLVLLRSVPKYVARHLSWIGAAQKLCRELVKVKQIDDAILILIGTVTVVGFVAIHLIPM